MKKQHDVNEGFDCECGKHHQFGGYVAAHWHEELIHICECGRKHSVQMGYVRLLGRKKSKKEAVKK